MKGIKTPEELAQDAAKKSAELCSASCRTIDFERREKTLGWLCKDENSTECKNYKEVCDNMKNLCTKLNCKYEAGDNNDYCAASCKPEDFKRRWKTLN